MDKIIITAISSVVLFGFGTFLLSEVQTENKEKPKKLHEVHYIYECDADKGASRSGNGIYIFKELGSHVEVIRDTIEESFPHCKNPYVEVVRLKSVDSQKSDCN